jgi:hypothetical protein
MHTLPTSNDGVGGPYLSVENRYQNAHNYFRCLLGAKTRYGGDSFGGFALLATNEFMNGTSFKYANSLC